MRPTPSTDPYAAQEEAERRIAQALASRAETIDFSDLAVASLPASIVDLAGQLKKLRLTDIAGRTLRDLRSIVGLSNLQLLDLSGCDQLEDLAPLAGLSSLHQLNLSNCYALRDFDALASLLGLRQLDLRRCAILQLGPLIGLSNLQHLSLSDCWELPDLGPLAGLSNLQQLDLSGNPDLQDLGPLTGLSRLQRLNLRGCRQLRELGPLAGLSRLQHLNLIGCAQLRDLRPLPSMSSLRRLDLGQGMKFSDLSPLAGLSRLRRLDLSGSSELQDNLCLLAVLSSLQHLNLSDCKQLTDLRPLAGLSGLRWLNLNECQLLQDLGPLAGLSNLKRLDLRGCKQLQDLGPLAGLSSLRRLNLEGCFDLEDVGPLAGISRLQRLNLRNCLRLRDVGPLAGLLKLQVLDLSNCRSLHDLSPLAGLSSLKRLNLDQCNVYGIDPLASLHSLQHLRLWWCGLQDLGPLAGLRALVTLDVGRCRRDLDTRPLADLTSLRELHAMEGPSISLQRLGEHAGSDFWPELTVLRADQVLGVPAELSSSGSGDNCLPRIKAWFAELERGIVERAEMKVLVLGNGKVGKTQICRRLRGERFDPLVPTTHGIQLGEQTIDVHNGVGSDTDLTILRFWDFGGQDIYLGTHALFLDQRAIYVIAWCPKAENCDETEQHGMILANRPLPFWIEYVRSLTGPDATVVVAQTQCDREADVLSRAPLPAQHGFNWLRETACSADQDKRPDGMDRLLTELRAAVRRQTELHGRFPMPASWAAMGQTLAGLRDGRHGTPRTSISVEDFNELAVNRHGALAPSVLLEYLHRGGQVFWNQQAFGGQIVLQLDWALQGIYAVLERDRLLPILRSQHGLFTPELLQATVWQDKTSEERHLLLSMMEQCRIAFKADDAHYIAPAALPAEQEVAQRIEREWRGAKADTGAILNYDFLHEGVLRAMLCELGLQAGHSAVYWRYGVCFYDMEAKSTIRIRSQQPNAEGQGGWIEVAASGGRADIRVAQLVEAIRGVKIGREPRIDWQEGAHVAGPLGAQALDEREGMPQDREGKSDSFAAVRPGPRPRPPEQPLPVYVSYSWGADSESMVDKMEEQLRAQGIELVRDKRRVRPGDWLSVFTAEIGRADVVLVVLSKRYLERYYCMQELLHLFHRSLGDKSEFLERVVPVIPTNLALESELDRLEYVDYWIKKDAEFSAKVATVGAERLSPAGREEWLAIKDFANRTAELLSWVADSLMPRGFEAAGPVTEMLKRRAGRMPRREIAIQREA